MDGTQNVLQLVLSELQIPAQITTVSDRKAVQKSIYLAQAAGVPLGYSFSWYLMGPYSPGLTRDYYGLLGDNPVAVSTQPASPLKPIVAERLRELRPLFEVPVSAGISQAEWLELLASVHYLQYRMRLTGDQLETKLRDLKPSLYPHYTEAQECLSRAQSLFTK